MVRSQKTKIVLSICLVFLLSVGSFVYIYSKGREKEEIGDAVKGVETVVGVPYIVNIPPVSAHIGEEYVFVIQVVDSDSKRSKISYELLEGPSWLSLEGTRLRGIPLEGNEGSYKIVLKVSDGENSSTKESYILVE